MMHPFMRALANIFFTMMLTPLFLFQRVTETKPIRKFVEFFFGRLLAPQYHKVIAMYGPLYGVALAKGLDAAVGLLNRPVRTIVDCGTGTGFVSQTVAARFPDAHILSVDAVMSMLEQARNGFVQNRIYASPICADTAKMPLPDAIADLVVAQNTTPFLREFARICAPGGVIVFADSSARYVAGIAGWAARRTGLVDEVRTGIAETGFFLIMKVFQR